MSSPLLKALFDGSYSVVLNLLARNTCLPVTLFDFHTNPVPYFHIEWA